MTTPADDIRIAQEFAALWFLIYFGLILIGAPLRAAVRRLLRRK